MTIPQVAERARARYAAPLYRTALLLKPEASHAARAVVTAFTSLDWSAIALDEQLEARLVAAMPPVPRRWWGQRAKPPQPLAALPAAFWRLSPTTRVALGLRLLRGMATPLIADALRLPLTEVQTLLLDGVAQAGGLATVPLAEDCRRLRALRLDDPQAERSHGLRCIACQSAGEAWERAETRLSAQLAAIGGLPLPPQVDGAIRAAFEQGARRQARSSWRHPWLWQLALVTVVLVALGSLLWPRQAGRPQGTLATGEPKAILEQARAAYLGMPEGDGVIHRRWEIAIKQPSMKLQADEWVDSAQPAKHRMQLLDNTTVKEWQVGDGRERWHYRSAFAPLFCGPMLAGQRAINIHSWKMGSEDQARMRAVRWQAGAWSLGLHYLDLAGEADSLRSLGVAGNGEAAELTLLAEGGAIEGSLLLRLDPDTRELREVREVRSANGETTAYVPWRLVLQEIVDPDTAGKQNLLDHYPNNRPEIERHEGPLIDPGCPLTALAAPLSLLRVLAEDSVTGLPVLSGGLSNALLIGRTRDEREQQALGNGYSDPGLLQLVYSGPGKRLLISRLPSTSSRNATSVQAGPWTVRLDELLPGHFVAELIPASKDASAAIYNGDGNLYISAQGWKRDELLAVLAAVRPLGLDDWARAPDLYFEPEPLDAVSQERLVSLIESAALKPGKTLHQIEILEQRRAPYLLTLNDPYHKSLKISPPETRTESWITLDGRGNVEHLRSITTAPSDDMLSARWSDDETTYYFDARRNTVVTATATLQDHGWMLPAAQLRELLRPDWQWQRLPDGRWLAEYSRPFSETHLEWILQNQISGGEAFGPWLRDPLLDTILFRREWGADGLPRYSETLGIVRNVHEENFERPLSSTIVLERTEWETLEWLPTAPAGAQGFELPADVDWLTSDADVWLGESATTVGLSVAEAAETMPFTVWQWADETSGIKFQSSRVPEELNLPVHRHYPQTFKDAVKLGLALELRYATPEGSLRLTEGPAPKLRRLLQQSMPLWRSSERRTVEIEGRAYDLWVMQGDKTDTHWAVIERDQTLVFMEHKGSATEWANILQEVAQMQPVVVD